MFIWCLSGCFAFKDEIKINVLLHLFVPSRFNEKLNTPQYHMKVTFYCELLCNVRILQKTPILNHCDKSQPEKTCSLSFSRHFRVASFPAQLFYLWQAWFFIVCPYNQQQAGQKLQLLSNTCYEVILPKNIFGLNKHSISLKNCIFKTVRRDQYKL